MANTIHVDVVSAEESIFSGEARFVALPGEAGELGIYPRHTPLITRVKPGSVRIETNSPGELPNVAFKTPAGKKVLIVLNTSASTRSCSAVNGLRIW